MQWTKDMRVQTLAGINAGTRGLYCNPGNRSMPHSIQKPVWIANEIPEVWFARREDGGTWGSAGCQQGLLRNHVPERSDKTSTISTKQTVHEGKYTPVCETVRERDKKREWRREGGAMTWGITGPREWVARILQHTNTLLCLLSLHHIFPPDKNMVVEG